MKASLFDRSGLVKSFIPSSIKEVVELVADHKVIASSVRESNFITRLKNELPQLVIFDHNTPIPITNSYHTPDTLGLDRLAGVIGARSIYPKNNVLVIDMGTCITYDLINSESIFLGGAISPGMKMRFEAMHRSTANLPLIKSNDFSIDELGRDSKSCINVGVKYGIIHEIVGTTRRYSKEFEELRVVLTGGDALFFESTLKEFIFAPFQIDYTHEPSLVSIGLDVVLRFNEDL